MNVKFQVGDLVKLTHPDFWDEYGVGLVTAVRNNANGRQVMVVLYMKGNSCQSWRAVLRSEISLIQAATVS